MSSLANAIKRKTHKERSQPNARRKYGLLEKHKDYVLRAKDFHKKDDTIKTLKRKAEERNPDEFYFAMESKRTKEGVHNASLTQANKYSQAELRLMKTQDMKYLSLKGRVEAEKVRRLQSGLHFVGLPGQAKHTVFVEDEREARTFDPAAYFDTPKELLGRSFNRPRKAELESQDVLPLTARTRVADRSRVASYRELAQRSERQTKLSRLAADMAYRKELMGKGSKRKLRPNELAAAVVEGHPPMHKWRRERKR